MYAVALDDSRVFVGVAGLQSLEADESILVGAAGHELYVVWPAGAAFQLYLLASHGRAVAVDQTQLQASRSQAGFFSHCSRERANRRLGRVAAMPGRACVWIGLRACPFAVAVAFALALACPGKQHEARASLGRDGERRGLQLLAIDHGLGVKLGADGKIGECRAAIGLGFFRPLGGLATRSGHRGHDFDLDSRIGQRAATHPHGHRAHRQVADHQRTRCHGLRIVLSRWRLRDGSPGKKQQHR